MAKILLIDDEESVRTVLRIALERDGYDVEEAVNGRQGLALYGERPADLVITDIAMPEMNGLDMMVELTQKFLNVKVIAMSGGADSLTVAKQLGACETVQKPFNLDQLLGMIRYALAH
jgi:DNA-binding NtrC family response regulator